MNARPGCNLVRRRCGQPSLVDAAPLLRVHVLAPLRQEMPTASVRRAQVSIDALQQLWRYAWQVPAHRGNQKGKDVGILFRLLIDHLNARPAGSRQ